MPEATPIAGMSDELTSRSLAQDEDLEELLEEEMDEAGVMDDATEDVEPSTKVVRYTHASYFERMVPNRAYPLLIKISIQEMKARKSVTSIISGEKLGEIVDSMVISTETHKLTIQPEFAGCFVVPSQIEVDTREEKVEGLFHVTPLALGSLDSSIKFIQNGAVIHQMILETKVITHRLSKWAAWFGAAASTVPAIVAFLLNEQPTDFMKDRLETFAPSLKDLGAVIPGALTAVFLGFSGVLYWLRRPKRISRSVAFPS
jgi:hypothetical protein